MRITEGGTAPRITTFDGGRVLSPSGAITSDQTKLLQTIALDAPETLFNQFAAGEPYRDIGAGIKVKQADATSANEFVDVYQLIPARTAPKLAAAAAPRFVAFETASGYLRYVAHVEADGTKVISQFEDWKTTNNESYASTIRRLENGVEVFRISFQNMALGQRLGVGAF